MSHSFYCQRALANFLHTVTIARRKLVHKEAFTHRSFYTHAEAFAHSMLLDTEALTHRKLLHPGAFYKQRRPLHSKLLQTDSYLQTESVCTQPAFTRSRPDTQQAFTRSFTQRNCPHELPFIAGCSQITRKNTVFLARPSSPTQVPCTIPAAITMRFAPLPQVTTSPSHHFSKSPLPQVTGDFS